MTKAQGLDIFKVTGNMCVKLKLLINFQSKTRIVHYFYNGLKLSHMILGQYNDKPSVHQFYMNFMWTFNVSLLERYRSDSNCEPYLSVT